MTEEFTPLAKRNQSLGLKAKAFFFLQKSVLVGYRGRQNGWFLWELVKNRGGMKKISPKYKG